MASSGYYLRPRGRNERMDEPKDERNIAAAASSRTTTATPNRKKPTTDRGPAERNLRKRQTSEQREETAPAAPAKRTGRQQRKPESNDDDSMDDEFLADLLPLKRLVPNERERPDPIARSSSEAPRVDEEITVLDRYDSTLQAAASSRPNRPVSANSYLATRSPSPDGVLPRHVRDVCVPVRSRINEQHHRSDREIGANGRIDSIDMESTIVITLSDSEDDEDNRERVGGRGHQEPDNRMGTSASASVAPPWAGDEEYARRLQRELDMEHWREERVRRAQRSQNLITLTGSEERGDAGTSTSTTSQQPASNSVRLEERQSVDGTDTLRNIFISSIRSGPFASPVMVDALPPRPVPAHQPRPMPNNPPLTAFHRRPVPAADNAQAAHQSVVFQPQVRMGPDVAQDGASQGNVRDHVRRMQRMWFRHAIRYGDFDQLESALLDLALALGDGLTDEQLERLPVSVASRNRMPPTNTTCTICMEEFIERDVQRHLPCLHTFHKHCIDVWLKQKSTCPICRVDARGNVAS